MSDIEDRGPEPTEAEKDAQADGRVAEQETADAVDESSESKPGDTIEDSGGEVRGQASEGAVLDENAFGGSGESEKALPGGATVYPGGDSSGGEVPPVTETDGDVDANAERMDAEIAKAEAEADEDEDKGDDTDYEGSIALEAAALAWHRAREANSGNEPSLSVFQRAEDDLAAVLVGGDDRLYESGRIVLDTAATLLGKLRTLAEGSISREEVRQWLEENFPE